MGGKRSAVMFQESAVSQLARGHQDIIPNTADTRQDGSMFISKDPNI